VVHHCFRVLVIVVALASLLVVPALRQAPTAAANSAPPAANQSISFVGSIGGQLDTIAVAGRFAAAICRFQTHPMTLRSRDRWSL
jgi:hypothetical protein